MLFEAEPEIETIKLLPFEFCVKTLTCAASDSKFRFSSNIYRVILIGLLNIHFGKRRHKQSRNDTPTTKIEIT